MSNVVEIPHIVKPRNFILLKNTTLTNNKKNCSAEAAATSIISSSTKILRSADLNEFPINNSSKRLILPCKGRLAPKTSSLENGKSTTTFIFLPVSLSLTAVEKQCEGLNLVQSTAKMDDLADAFKFKSASTASSLQSYQNGGGGAGGNGFYANNGHFDETCLKNESTASLALKRHSIVVENRLNSTKKSRLSTGGLSSNKISYSAPTTPKNSNNFVANGEHTTSLDDTASSTSKNFGAARAILADRLKNSQKNRQKFQPKEETINEGICFKSNGIDSNDREISLDRKGDIFIDLTGTNSSLAITAPTTQNGDYFSFSDLPASNNDRCLSYPVSATFPNSLISGDNLLNDNELILLTPPTTSTQSAGPASLFFEHNDLLHRPPPLPFEIGYQHQTTVDHRSLETTPASGSSEPCATILTNISNNENVLSPVAAASSFNQKQQQQNDEYTTNNHNQPHEKTKNEEITSINEIQYDSVCRPNFDLVDALSFPPSTSTAYVVQSSEIMPNDEIAPDSFHIARQQSELVAGQAPTSVSQDPRLSTAAVTVNLKTPKQPSAMCGYVTLEKDGRTQTPCRQRCINGFKFCIRHILNDSSAPYRPCAHVRITGTKSIPCNNAVLQQANVNSKYCGTHLIMMGLRTPKTRKTKNAPSAEQGVKNSVGCSSSITTTTTTTTAVDPVVKSTKKSTNKSAKSQRSTQEKKDLNENYANFAAPPTCFLANNNNNNINDNNCDNTANEYFTIDNQQQQQSQYLMQQNLYSNHQGSSGSTPSSSNYHNQDFSIASRPDSQVSVSSSSMQYINNTNNNGYCSPQSPWRSNVQTQQPAPPNVSLADIAKNNPKLLSKLTFNPENKEILDESNTITLYTIPENSIIYSPNQNLISPPKNFVLSDQNFLLRSDDPFLCPQNSSSSFDPPNTPQKFIALQQRSFHNFQQQQSVTTNNILSPVPSDLSVESSGSQSSANVRHANFLNQNIYQQQATNSSFLQQNLQTQTILTENQECQFVLSNGQHQLSGQSFIASNLPPISRSHSTRPSAEIMLASPVPSPSVSIPRPYSSSLLPSNTNNNSGNGILNANPYPSIVNQPRQQIIRQIEQQDGKICYLISDISVPGLDPHMTIPSTNKKIVDQSKVASSSTNQMPLASLPNGTVSNQSTTPGIAHRTPNVAVAPPTKPKKVIRLKPKKRKLKMTGKYREIGFVNQMCRVVEDFDFDNTDLFPLGLEPSSSDSDSDDDMSHTGNMSLPKFDYDNFIVPQIADSFDNNNSVSSAFLSKAKRQLYLLKKNLNLTCKDLRRKHIESKIVGSTARLFPNSCGQAFYDLKCSNNNRSNSKSLAQIKRYQTIKRPSRHMDLGVVPKKCTYRFGACDSKENKCQEKCLPYSIMCPKHILAHNDQILFRNCTYRGSDDCPESPCPMTALPAGLTEEGSFRCYKHQSKDLHKNLANPKEIAGSVNNELKDKKRSKKTTAKKTTRKRKKKQTVPLGPYSDHGMAVIRPLYTPDEEVGESAEEHANEEYSNQDAQAALASVAKDFGFANYDLTDMLVRMPDESLIDNILDQDFSKSSLTELQPLQNVVAAIAPSPSTSSLPQSLSAATSLRAAAAFMGGGVETFEHLTTATVATGDHNWADIEQFLLEENIKASSSVSPTNNDLTSPATVADLQTSTTPLLHYNDNNLQYFDPKKNNGQKREELRSLDGSADVQNVQLLR